MASTGHARWISPRKSLSDPERFIERTPDRLPMAAIVRRLYAPFGFGYGIAQPMIDSGSEITYPWAPPPGSPYGRRVSAPGVAGFTPAGTGAGWDRFFRGWPPRSDYRYETLVRMKELLHDLPFVPILPHVRRPRHRKTCATISGVWASWWSVDVRIEAAYRPDGWPDAAGGSAFRRRARGFPPFSSRNPAERCAAARGTSSRRWIGMDRGGARSPVTSTIRHLERRIRVRGKLHLHGT